MITKREIIEKLKHLIRECDEFGERRNFTDVVFPGLFMCTSIMTVRPETTRIARLEGCNGGEIQGGQLLVHMRSGKRFFAIYENDHIYRLFPADSPDDINLVTIGCAYRRYEDDHLDNIFHNYLLK